MSYKKKHRKEFHGNIYQLMKHPSACVFARFQRESIQPAEATQTWRQSPPVFRAKEPRSRKQPSVRRPLMALRTDAAAPEAPYDSSVT